MQPVEPTTAPALIPKTATIRKTPKGGKCPHSCFAGGWSRVGLVPVECVLDGGLSVCRTQEMCLECGRVFSRTGFVVCYQPNRPGGSWPVTGQVPAEQAYKEVSWVSASAS